MVRWNQTCFLEMTKPHPKPNRTPSLSMSQSIQPSIKKIVGVIKQVDLVRLPLHFFPVRFYLWKFGLHPCLPCQHGSICRMSSGLLRFFHSLLKDLKLWPRVCSRAWQVGSFDLASTPTLTLKSKISFHRLTICIGKWKRKSRFRWLGFRGWILVNKIRRSTKIWSLWRKVKVSAFT